MLQATVALAQRVERMEIDFCGVLARVGDSGGGASIEAGGGRAVFGSPGAPMNKVLGLGVGTAVTDADLDAIELFYDERDCPIQIELCPLVSLDLVAKLHTRGYALKGFENELARLVPSSEPAADSMFQVPGSGVEVQVLDDHRDEEVWLRVTTEGFAVPDSSSTSEAPTPEVLDTISRIMRTFVHKDIVRYLVRIDGEPAAAASSTITRGVLGIFGTATVPAYRGRGAQSAIVSRAVQNAAGVADLAIATVEPGSISQRTFERCGFQVLYTRAILVRH